MADEDGSRDRLLTDLNLLRQLVEHSQGLMCVHDLDGNLLFVNRGAAEALGFRPEDGIGWSLRRFLAPPVEGEFDAYLDRIRHNPTDSGLMRLMTKDGSERIWLYRNVRYEEPGMPPRVLGHAHDVTERIHAERALRESERRFRRLADTAPVLIRMTDARGACVFVNETWLAFTGRALEQELGDAWMDNVHPDDRAWVTPALQVSFERRQPYRLEYRVRRADGEYRWMLDTGAVRSEAGGELAGYIGSCTDVTESRRAKQVLARARDELAVLVAERTAELERANAQLRAEMRQRLQAEEDLARVRRMEALGVLAGGVAHEFSNLLTVITGRSQLLLDRLPADTPLRAQVEMIDRTALQAATLIRQLLAFSRKQILQPRLLAVNKLVTEILPRVRPLLGPRVEVVARLAPALAPVRLDAAQIEHALLSLAANAGEAMGREGRLILETANVAADAAAVHGHPGARPGAYVRLSLSDTRAGMDAAARARIFEPFSMTGLGNGETGLGLATVHGIVEQHGGFTTVTSEPGGTVFHLHLPAADGRPPATQSL